MWDNLEFKSGRGQKWTKLKYTHQSNNVETGWFLQYSDEFATVNIGLQLGENEAACL